MITNVVLIFQVIIAPIDGEKYYSEVKIFLVKSYDVLDKVYK